MLNKSKQGKKNRASGARFELKVRGEMEKDDWVISKWMNNVDVGNNKLIIAKRKYNPFLRALSVGTGFPDFVGIKRKGNLYEVIGIEVKSNGWLDKEEKEKCNILLSKKIFSKILIAKKGKKRGEIVYNDFEQKNISI